MSDLLSERGAPADAGAIPTLLTRDIPAQVLDFVLLFVDDRLHAVPDRDHADEVAVLHDRQVADALVRHELHALVDRLCRPDVDDRRAHDRADQRLGGLAAHQHDLARVVALRDDAREPPALEYRQGADEVIGHQLDRGADRFRGVDGDDAGLLPLEQLPNGSHGSPPETASHAILRPRGAIARATRARPGPRASA